MKSSHSNKNNESLTHCYFTLFVRARPTRTTLQTQVRVKLVRFQLSAQTNINERECGHIMTETVNKKELVATIAEILGSTKKDANIALDGVVEAVKQELKAGKNVSIVGFAKFTSKLVPERTASVPVKTELETGEVKYVKQETVVPEHVTYKAKISKSL